MPGAQASNSKRQPSGSGGSSHREASDDEVSRMDSERRRLELMFRHLGLRKPPPVDAADVDDAASRWRTGLAGGVLVLASLGFAAFTLYSTVLAPRLPPTGIAWLDGFRGDGYYCFLIPMTLPPTVLFFYLNWAAMAFYRSN